MKRLPLLACLVLAAACGLRYGLHDGVRPASAEGAVLDGLMAPELTFPAGLNGITRGQSLSAFRGKVVWIKFWLRDCPHCRKTLPLAQQMHELYGNSGLVVLTIVHQYAPDEVKPFLDQNRYTFPVACDPTGALAQAYQVDRRPTDYVVGIDGRVRLSNRGPEDVLQEELARFRVAELGKVPSGLDAVREKVRAWEYGPALALARSAAEPVTAPADVRDFAQRLEALAGERLTADIARAQVLVRLGRADEALGLLRSLATGFAGTPHEVRAREALAAREAAAGR
ncbi:MAG: peroxiredoxin family protein [Planctomycetia bacterium]